MRSIVFVIACLLSGCTSIDGLVIITSNVGDGCYAERGADVAAQGAGEGQVTAQVLGLNAALAALLESRVGCGPVAQP